MHKVIFDTDPGVDDAMALLFLHNHPEIDLIGVTSVFGNASDRDDDAQRAVPEARWNIPGPGRQGRQRNPQSVAPACRLADRHPWP